MSNDVLIGRVSVNFGATRVIDQLRSARPVNAGFGRLYNPPPYDMDMLLMRFRAANRPVQCEDCRFSVR